ncbi:hypothetical protein Nepgr_024526 [Nepenthes gracilis]|uniref:1-aminocyclopropane-1-carboxylate synthase n=1 Tax=Nepenthes gracilis TaxID=150966 RepID=A0AAD3T2Z9_NEPGR|nr:hypothetical protein Nepgr_024526 [Nepenthes gracilis]
MEIVKEDQQKLLSKMAVGGGHGEDSHYFDGWKAYNDDPFHPTENTNGVIQLGLAENQLCFDLTKEWMTNNPEASICTAEGVDGFQAVANFQDYHGLPRFRKAVARFMEKQRGGRVRFDPDRIVMSGGATGAHETLAFCLANRGDAFLVPTPYYPGYDRDVGWRTDVQLLPIECDSSNNFVLTKSALEAAYDKAKEANIKVKGLIINNPSNPLGTVLDRDTLRTIVSFINQNNLHLVCDEIYAGTVFTQPDFTSISEIVEEDRDCNCNLIHIVYSLSKDMGLPGFRVGIVYSYNDDVVRCARKMSSFGLVSTQTQYLIASMLSDDEFVEKYIYECRMRLAARYKAFTWGLCQMGIHCLNSNAGLFVWMDLRHLLSKPTIEAETKLWTRIINEVKLNVSPGSSFHCLEPGWFRVCFANIDDETMKLTLRRIESFVMKKKEGTVVPAKRKCWQRNMQLRLSSKRLDDVMMVSQMSPHSPISQSPLVPART